METAGPSGPRVIEVLLAGAKATIHTHTRLLHLSMRLLFWKNKQRRLKKNERRQMVTGTRVGSGFWGEREPTGREGGREGGAAGGSVLKSRTCVYLYKRELSSGSKTKWGIMGDQKRPSCHFTRCPPPAPPSPRCQHRHPAHPGVLQALCGPLCCEDTSACVNSFTHISHFYLQHSVILPNDIEVVGRRRMCI